MRNPTLLRFSVLVRLQEEPRKRFVWLRAILFLLFCFFVFPNFTSVVFIAISIPVSDDEIVLSSFLLESIVLVIIKLFNNIFIIFIYKGKLEK